jgi:hypothetical protein
MINFAELKLKLTEYSPERVNIYIDTYMDVSGQVPNYSEVVQDYATKDAKIISELLEIIEMQNFSLNAYANNLPDIQDGEWIATMPPPYEKTAKITLSETESKLKQLIKGV